eukprot:Unigene2060_Nuclearia_a/m.6417 Unigene2060_Nuclearia_a/g.6417  ORF Unigene2060_Nuclearia_a/g.6417 Unigene2060_Nuclearia_a/m.6417 type:complete len:305 (-) Unigene2060_Nuclearia_a:149-1063(-)
MSVRPSGMLQTMYSGSATCIASARCSSFTSTRASIESSAGRGADAPPADDNAADAVPCSAVAVVAVATCRSRYCVMTSAASLCTCSRSSPWRVTMTATRELIVFIRSSTVHRLCVDGSTTLSCISGACGARMAATSSARSTRTGSTCSTVVWRPWLVWLLQKTASILSPLRLISLSQTSWPCSTDLTALVRCSTASSSPIVSAFLLSITRWSQSSRMSSVAHTTVLASAAPEAGRTAMSSAARVSLTRHARCCILSTATHTRCSSAGSASFASSCISGVAPPEENGAKKSVTRGHVCRRSAFRR